MGIKHELSQCSSLEQFEEWKNLESLGRIPGNRGCSLCGVSYDGSLPKHLIWDHICYHCTGTIPGWAWAQSWEGIQQHQKKHHEYWRGVVERTTPEITYQVVPPCTPGRSVIR